MNTKEKLERIIKQSKIMKYVYKVECHFAIEKPKTWKSLYTAISGEDKWVENKIEELAQSILNAGYKKIKPFEWMERWLKAYDKEHKTNFAKEVLDWINQQPMAGG